MHLRVLYHGNCFDGCSSAAIFSRFFRERVAAGPVDVAFRPLDHRGPGDPFPDGCFDGDDNACVDFRYSQSPRLTWWFDHHASAFQLPGDEAHFRADASGQKFFDPRAKSCTGFLARTAAARFGFDVGPLAELLHWAEIIDGALFTDARMAVELAEPALQLMTWIEANREPGHADRFIADLAAARPLAEIAAAPYVKGALGALMDQHRRNVEVIRTLARVEDRVVVFDLSGTPSQSFNKFISYYLHPEALYLVGLSVGSRVKISVGSNPWRQGERRHDIAAICGRYGGGGHAAVGAVNLPRDQIERGREVQREIVDELRR